MLDFLTMAEQVSWTYLWLVLAVGFLVIELITVGLTSIWMTGGALAAMVVSLLHGPVWLQIIIFFAVTFVLLYFTRPWAVKYLNQKKTATNYETVIGKQVKVIDKVDNTAETGRALYNGMEWTARAYDRNEVFEKDEEATVVAIEGVKLLLAKHGEDGAPKAASDEQNADGHVA